MAYKAGRPKKEISDAFLIQLAEDYRTRTAKETAMMYNCSATTIRRWIRIAKDRGLVKEQ